jgi:hypothetical protein
MLVRIKPPSPRKGLKLRRYTVHGHVFHAERGWYEVNDTVAAYLKTVRNDAENIESPLAFDVCTQAEANEMKIAEERAKRVRAEADDPVRAHRIHDTRGGTLTTADLPAAPKPKALASFDQEGDESDLDSDDLSAVVAPPATVAPPPGSPAARKAGATRSRAVPVPPDPPVGE